MKKKILVLNNFEVTPNSLGGKVFSYTVESKSKNFKVTFGLSTAMFAIFNEYFEDSEMFEYLESLITMVYQITMVVPDMEFFEEYAKMVNSMIERMKSEEPEEESEEEILLSQKINDLIQEADAINGTDTYGEVLSELEKSE